MKIFQTKFEIVSINAGMKEWHSRPKHRILSYEN